jgi:hypothetical protein
MMKMITQLLQGEAMNSLKRSVGLGSAMLLMLLVSKNSFGQEPTPVNDEPCFALPAACGDEITGTTNFATGEGTPESFCGTTPGNLGVWYVLEGANQEVTVNTFGSDFDTKLNVYTDACILLECVGGNDDTDGLQSQVIFDAIDGESYWIYVSGFGSATGNFALNVSCEDLPEPVANDDVCGAIAIACEQPIEGSTAGATADNAPFCGTSNTAPGVWYNLLADFDGSINFSTCNAANYDTKITVYSADDCESELVCVGGNDDGVGCSGFTSDITVDVEAGQNLYILVHGFGSASGEFTLSTTCEEIIACENTEYNLVVDGGTWAGEVSWNLLLDGEIVADGGAPITDEVLCLADGCYTLELFDSFGDGWNGNEFSLFLGDELVAGPFTLEDGEEGIAEFGLGDVVCGEPACENYEYYLADILEDGTTNIYEVSINGSDAELSWVATSEYEVHIALNEENGLLYAVSKLDGSFRTLDPSTGVFGPVELLDLEVSEIIGATFNADGKLMISSQSENAIYSVMLGSNEVSVFDSYSPILGGDIDFGQDGALYLATREGFGTFYLAIPDGIASDILQGDAPQLVTGLADTEGGQLIFSHRDATTLEVRDYDGTAQAPLNILMDGEPFMTFNGDLASGCADNRQPGEEDCQNFKIFYANHGSGVDGTDIYGIELVDGNAEMSLLTNVSFEAHIAYDGEADIVYLVNANGSFVRAYDPTNNIFLGDLPIDGNINQLYAVVYNPADGFLYVGDANDDEIFTIDLGSGLATYFADGEIEGGDLALQDGKLYLASRSNDRLFEITGGAGVEVGNIPADVNGLGAANNATDLLISNFGSDAFFMIGGDGSVLETYPALLDGESFTLNNGDLASGCGDSDNVEACNYELYYIHVPQSGDRELLAVTLNEDGTTSNSVLMVNPPNNHIGLSPDGATLYMVGNGNVNTFDIESATVTNTVSIATADGSGLSGFPAAVVAEDGTLYAGNSGSSQVYTIDPVSGLATPFGSSVSVQGGDLIFAPTGEAGEDELWVITRGNNTFTRVSDGVSFTVAVNEINGAAVLENGNVLLADGNGEGLFKEIDLSDASVVAEYETGLALFNGDLAGGCTSGDVASDDDNIPPVQAEGSNNTLSSYPNPTNGPSVAIFVTGQTERATLEVYDMNGRLVEGLFSGMAEGGVEYRVDFNGLDLPNGVYMYRLTTEKETIVEKFMIAR